MLTITLRTIPTTIFNLAGAIYSVNDNLVIDGNATFINNNEWDSDGRGGDTTLGRHINIVDGRLRIDRAGGNASFHVLEKRRLKRTNLANIHISC